MRPHSAQHKRYSPDGKKVEEIAAPFFDFFALVVGSFVLFEFSFFFPVREREREMGRRRFRT